jgi:hypothetical protein
MSTFMLYVLLVSCVVASAALLAERALAAFDRPTRGVWLTALLASAALPVARRNSKVRRRTPLDQAAGERPRASISRR